MSDQQTLSSEARGGWLRGMARMKVLGGSLVSWVTLGVSLVGFAITFGATTASVTNGLNHLGYQVSRNRDEAIDRIKSVEGSVSNLYTSMSAIHSIKTDVEVIKEQIKAINDSMRRIERGQQRGEQQQQNLQLRR